MAPDVFGSSPTGFSTKAWDAELTLALALPLAHER